MDRLIKVVIAGMFVILATKVQAQTESNKPKKNQALAQVQKTSSRAGNPSGSITIVPNPVVDDFEVHTSLNDWIGGTITLQDRFGRIIERIKISEDTSFFTLKNKKKGVYTLTVRKGARERILKVIKM